MDPVIAVASSGFRLSLLLNAVGTGMANPDCNIHDIAKGISLFSLMLKQTARTMMERGQVASSTAINVTTEVSNQGQLIFDEIKSMTDLSQGRDEKGILRSINIAEKNKWAFKKYKVLYLLGQLESLKLSLAIMLQVLQMGKAIADTHHDPTTLQLAGKTFLQDRAEIQNLIVVQHWSLVELRRLYQLAENEAKEEALAPLNDDPPPSYDEHRAIEPSYYAQKANEGDVQLSITAPPVRTDDTSRAMVKYQERPIQQLDAAFTRALVRENQAIGAPVDDIVDHLLEEWTQVPELDSHPVTKGRRPGLNTYYESDEEDTTESEYDDTHVKGRYIEGPKKVKKDVRFRARVESDSEEERRHVPRHRAPTKHILRSEDDSSSDSEAPPPVIRSQPSSRRNSEASNTKYSPNAHDSRERNPRPYSSGGRNYRPDNSTNYPTPGPIPGSRGMPPPPMGPMPTRSMPNVNQWQGPPPVPQPGLRPLYPGPPSNQPRPSSRGSYGPPGYMGHSPQAPPGAYFPHQQRPQGPPMAPRPRPPRQHRHRSELQKAEDDKHAAHKNMKRGLFGGAALAGIMDLLQGLDGI
ncbi:hypothetical protein ACLMJK_008188 [Lecanora helva]